MDTKLFLQGFLDKIAQLLPVVAKVYENVPIEYPVSPVGRDILNLDHPKTNELLDDPYKTFPRIEMDYMFNKSAKKDYPKFSTNPNIPEKTREIYKAVLKNRAKEKGVNKHELPDKEKELAARIAYRKSESTKAERKEGPPYSGRLARPKKG